MVDIANRLCTPEQAMLFATNGVIQTSQYAWVKEADGSFTLTYDSEEGFPKVVDWSEDADTYAAFDNTDLGILLASLGYYPAGPHFQMSGVHEEYKWWCDDVNSITSAEDALYQGHGKTETFAKAMMLSKLLNSGMVPTNWEYYKHKLKTLRRSGKNSK